MQNTILVVAVSSLDFLNFSEKSRLLTRLNDLERSQNGSAPHFLGEASFGQICLLSGRPLERTVRISRWDGKELLRLSKKSALEAAALGIKFVLYDDPLYPPLLREIADPPFALFYRGDISVLLGRTVSVVGTRRLSPEGRKAARDFSYEAASNAFCVVSGLAAGADGQAHRGALDAFFDKKSSACLTAAILAGGVDNIYPSSHKKIAGQIIENGGCVLSESAPGLPGEKWRFVSRNRIIAGLSPATLVVQAPPGSGALLTADFALGYNREIFFHQACFCKNALVLSSLVHKNLAAQKGAAALRKIQTRPESYIRDGAKIVGCFSDFLNLSLDK